MSGTIIMTALPSGSTEKPSPPSDDEEVPRDAEFVRFLRDARTALMHCLPPHEVGVLIALYVSDYETYGLSHIRELHGQDLAECRCGERRSLMRDARHILSRRGYTCAA